MLNVLWITNISVGGAASIMDIEENKFGGWLQGLFDHVSSLQDVSISVAFPKGRPFNMSASDDNAIYYTFPSGRMGSTVNRETKKRLQAIVNEAKPDIVHIFGTELPHSSEIMRICQLADIPVVVQLQGLIATIAEHYYGWLPEGVLGRGTLLEIVRGATPSRSRRRLRAAGQLECETLRLAGHVIGRTTYDRAWAAQVSPGARYHHNDEILREPFYEKRWTSDECEAHTILLGQAGYPYKGAHVALEALKILLKNYPSTRLKIAGPSPLSGSGLLSLIRRSAYGWYLKRLIDRNRLWDSVDFLGTLGALEMRNAFLNARVFVSSSSIENSSNSVSEAAILGMPIVASYVGGVTSLLVHGESGYFYQGDAPYMLAHYVSKMFQDHDLATDLGAAARIAAVHRHNACRNVDKLLEIYKLASLDALEVLP